jgi:hypothetical protein
MCAVGSALGGGQRPSLADYIIGDGGHLGGDRRRRGLVVATLECVRVRNHATLNSAERGRLLQPEGRRC